MSAIDDDGAVIEIIEPKQGLNMCDISHTMVIVQEELEAELGGEDFLDKIADEDERRQVERPRLLQLALQSASSIDGMDSSTLQELKTHVQVAKSRDQQLDLLLLKAAQYSGFIARNQQQSEVHKMEIDDDDSSSSSLCRGKFHQPTIMTGGKLKHFQLEGIRWLVTLWENGLSGILADEMGLGKTIQVIGLFAFLSTKGCSGPYIITAPLATLPNWCNEFKKWVPSMNILLYHGSKDERTELRRQYLVKSLQKSPSFPIIITSYEICIIDRRYLSAFDWKYLVVDEGQRIKNFNCRLVKDLKKLNTENRILLTGTPVQNSLDELWSLLNFVNPNIFDDLTIFKSWFHLFNNNNDDDDDKTTTKTKKRKHDDDDDDDDIKMILQQERRDWIITKLHEIMRPFLLRRTKADVALTGDLCLPVKCEVIVYCQLSAVQEELYKQIEGNNLRASLAACRSMMMKKLSSSSDGGDDDDGGGRVSEMNKLMNLRKCCDHVFMFGEPLAGQQYQKKKKVIDVDDDDDDETTTTASSSIHNDGDNTVIIDDDDDGPVFISDINKSLLTSTSGKMMILDTIITSLHQHRYQLHKTLVFSQFTTMLDILECYLNYKQMRFVRIDGTTTMTDRQLAIDAFKQHDDCSPCVFLLSTRAGGLGLNLATADTVILYDSDWNPQVDLQAMDRAHRIGQTRPVVVYRLVCGGTVEVDVMMKMQMSKRRLERVTIQAGGFGKITAGVNNNASSSSSGNSLSSSSSGKKTTTGTMSLKNLYSLLQSDVVLSKNDKAVRDGSFEIDERITDREFLLQCGKVAFSTFEVLGVS